MQSGCVGAIGVWAALVAASVIAFWNSVSCWCGVVGDALAVLGAGAEGVDELDSGLGVPMLGVDGALGELGALGIPGRLGLPGMTGTAAGGGATAGGRGWRLRTLSRRARN